MTEAPIRRNQGFDVTNSHFFEGPSGDKNSLEVWCYTDRLSYHPGDDVHLHAATSAESFELTVWRDGLTKKMFASRTALCAPRATMPSDFPAAGCDWPRVATIPIPQDAETGFYVVEVRARDSGGAVAIHHHGFFVKPHPSKRSRILLIAATSTWTAYTDWGGANAYYQCVAPDGPPFSPQLSIHRPFARGFVQLPKGAPRKPHAWRPDPEELPRYPPIEFAYARGLSKWYANAGWASYERPFAHWAEANGFVLDYATQTDLHMDPGLLDSYACAIVVGHDEYWSWEMRDAIDRFVERGGRFARFGGNLAWQIRLERSGIVQVCYKDLAAQNDPVAGTVDTRRLTGCWDDPVIGRPAARTFGLSAVYGVYAGVGALAARGGGFTTYRPDHWAFAQTTLGYGDIFGDEARTFGYEVDGLDYTVADGLPLPTFRDGAPENVQILAMGLAANRESAGAQPGARSYYGDSSAFLARLRYGRVDAEACAAASRGSGMIVHFSRGSGEVFNAGSSEWVAGLAAREPFTEQITRNVLQRFSGPNP